VGELDIRLLGPVDVSRSGASIPLGGRKPRALLALLALEAGRVVSVERLIDALWRDAQPGNNRAVLQSYVSVLRRAIGQDWIVRSGSGYLFLPQSSTLDLLVFRGHADAGRKALEEQRFADAVPEFEAAIALWRGDALGGIDGDWVDLERARLAESRLAVTADRFEAELGLGRGVQRIAELTALVAEYPLRERLRGQLMRALSLAGRQAEALVCFDQGRKLLSEELGVDPSPQLRATHAMILRAEEPEQPEPPAPAAKRVVPCQLPPDIADFTGRVADVRQLSDRLLAAGPESALTVCAVVGKPGAGKSTLAVHVAHRIRGHFGDGQLYGTLRGQDPVDVLARFLRSLGVADSAVPTGLEDRVLLYRTLLADRRMLIVLDDAASAAQVRPLLPGGGACAVLVTGRTWFTGLAGAGHLDLPVFGEPEALDLLGRLAGADRIAAEPVDAKAIVHLCGLLPLAVRIAGARLAARPRLPLAQFATRLSAARRPLDELTLGDLEVRGSLALSYAGLDATARTTLCRLGWLDASEFADWLIAPLLDCPVQDAEQAVEKLVDAQLLDISGFDAAGSTRYRLHDLTRAFAKERGDADEAETTVLAAVERVARCALALVERATDVLPSGVARPLVRSEHDPHLDAVTVGRLLADPVAWFDAEQITLVRLVERAGELNLAAAASSLAAALCSSSFAVRNQFGQWWRTHSAALAAAHRTGNRLAEASQLAGLGRLRYEQDRLDDAIDYYLQAIEIYNEVGEHDLRVITTLSLSAAQRERGLLAQAMASLDEVMPDLAALGDGIALARASHARGMLLTEHGEFTGALSACRNALDSYVDLGDEYGQALVLRSIGIVHRAVGSLRLAEEFCVKAVGLLGTLGDELMLAYAEQALAKVRIRQGRGSEVRAMLGRNLATCSKLQDGFGQALMLRTLGELELADGRFADAEPRFERALRWWEALDLPLWRARTLRDQSMWLRALHRDQEADAAWAEALGIFRRHGSREAHEPLPALARMIFSR
jgi:DNA-binding SARP family transcriptional activator